MHLRDFTTKEEMLRTYDLMHAMYPSITKEEYSNELERMIPNNYGQIVAFVDGEPVGLSGYWVGTKLWCGKYLECDNVYVKGLHRSKGVGKVLFDALEAKARELGCSMLVLDSYTDNFKAHKFFYNEGFVPRGFHFIKVLNKDMVR